MANQCTKFEDSSLSLSSDILWGAKIKHGSHEVTTPLSRLGLAMINLHTN